MPKVFRLLMPLTLLILTALMGCQERMEPTVSLTQEQWKQVKRHVLSEPPAPQRKVGAVFADSNGPLIELVGYDLEPKNLVTNQKFTLKLYWHALRTPENNWKVFVHLQPRNGGTFQNLDHHPVDNLFQTSLWEEGQYIEDPMTQNLQAGFPSSGADIFVGLFDERTGERLQIETAGAGEIVEDGKLKVGESTTKNDKLLTAALVTEAPIIDGDLSDPVWRVAGRTKGFVNASDGKPVNFSTTARAIYTTDAVYFGFDVRDRDIRTRFTKRDDKLWEQDCVEIYLNPDNDKGTYWEIQISPGPNAETAAPIFDAYFETHRRPAWEISKDATLAGMEARVTRKGTLNSAGNRQDDTSYTVEVKIPFTGLTTTPGGLERIEIGAVPPTEGTTWRMNFFRVDHNVTGSGTQTRHAAWSPSGGDFHNLEAFGTLEFGPAKDPNQQTRPQPARRPTGPVLKSRLTTHGGGINLGTVNRAMRQSDQRFMECLMGDNETGPTEPLSLVFSVQLDAEAGVESVVRPSANGLDGAILECMSIEVEGWSGIRLLTTPPPAGTVKDPGEPAEPVAPVTDPAKRTLEFQVNYTPAQEPAPGQPGQAVPGQAVPGQAVPGQAVPGQPVEGKPGHVPPTQETPKETGGVAPAAPTMKALTDPVTPKVLKKAE